jgi:hypothetical protein
MPRGIFDGIAEMHGMNEHDGGKILDMIHLFGLPGEDIGQMLIDLYQELLGDLGLPGHDFFREFHQGFLKGRTAPLQARPDSNLDAIWRLSKLRN